jgi:hypothetical protein
MSEKTLFVTKIEQLLRTNTAMSLSQLCQALNNRSRRSVYRDLKKVSLVTSFSHAGQYHALKSAAKFDLHDLWFFNEIAFAAQGTLKATLTFMITEADAGMTHRELKTRLRIPVQNTLADLIRSELVSRALLPEKRFLYVSKDEVKSKAQLKKRLVLQPQKAPTSLPVEEVQIKILVAMLSSPHRAIDDALFTEQLKKQGLKRDEQEIMAVLRYYDLKKN